MRMNEWKNYLSEFNLNAQISTSNISESKYIEIIFPDEDGDLRYGWSFNIRISNHKRPSYELNGYYTNHDYDLEVSKVGELLKGEVLNKIVAHRNYIDGSNELLESEAKRLKIENWDKDLNFWRNHR